MTHHMKLAKTPFNAVVSGYKTIELRLNDKKRQALNVGDFIEFTCVSDSGITVSKEIKALHRFSSFEKLYIRICRCFRADTLHLPCRMLVRRI